MSWKVACVASLFGCLVAGIPGPGGGGALAAEARSWMDTLDVAHPRPLLEKAWVLRARERLWLAGVQPEATLRRRALADALKALEEASRASTDPRERERLTRLSGRIRELGDTPGRHPAWRAVLAALAGIARDRQRELELLEEAIATPSKSLP